MTPRKLAPMGEVCINGRFLSQRITGVQRYAGETLLSLDELVGNDAAPGVRWTLLVPRDAVVPALRHLKVETLGRLRGHLWEQLELPWRTRKALLFSFGFTGPIVQQRQIVTVHDGSVIRSPRTFSRCFRLWYRLVVTRVAQRSPMTIAVSRFSAREAEQCYGVARRSLRIATEGWQHLDRVQPDLSVLDQHALRGKRFALAVSSPTPNKNFAAIAHALDMLGPAAPVCVVAGAAAAAVFNRAQLPSSMLHVGYVSDAQLKALYQHATCFVFPSFYEGFGIPPLEAMSCNCPVIASTAPAVCEVCGDAALYFDPREPRELASKLREVFGRPELRARMAAAGLKRASQYSWAESARLNLQYIEECLRVSGQAADERVSCHA